MMGKVNSLEALLAVIKGKPATEIIFDLLFVEDHPAFVRCVHRAIDLALRQMAENPELRSTQSEDQLTIELVGKLRMMDFDADHDTKVGGHVDIVIRGPSGYLWLGEAKKHKQDYAWLFQGFQQLNTRYATGLAGQDSGGLIIYSDQARVDQLMARWKAHLGDNHADIQFEDCPLNDMAFLSVHTHEKTGRKFTVRHTPLSVFFDPKDHKK